MKYPVVLPPPVAGPIFDEIRRISGALPYEDRVGPEDDDGKDMAYRVVADHIRTLCFAIADGAQVGRRLRRHGQVQGYYRC